MTGISETFIRSGVPISHGILAAMVLFAASARAQNRENAAAITDMIDASLVDVAPVAADGVPAEPSAEDSQGDSEKDDSALNRDAEADASQTGTEMVATPAEDDLLVPDNTPAIVRPIVRDPFWPPGYDPNPPPKVTPTPAVVPTAPTIPRATPTPTPVALPEPTRADWDAAVRQLKPIIGRSVDPEGNEVHFALLNNRLLAIGQPVSVNTALFAFSWRIDCITAAGVDWTPIEVRRLQDGKRFPPPQNDAL